MLYARFMHPEYGRAHDREQAATSGLVVGERYLVEDVEIGQSYTGIKLNCFRKAFNSVLFEFEEEDCSPIDIYTDPKYNPYIRRRGIKNE